MRSICISPANTDDLEAVCCIDAAAFVRSDRWNIDLWKGMLKSPGSSVLIGKHVNTTAYDAGTADIAVSSSCGGNNTEIFGFVAFERGGKIMKLAVLPLCQHRGLGGQLLDAALAVFGPTGKWSKCMGASLHVDPTNKAAVALYSRRGFTVDCVVTDYYSPGRDAWRMLRERN